MVEATPRTSQTGLPITYGEALRGCRAIEKDVADDARLTIAVGGNCNPAFLLPGLRLALAHEGVTVRIVETPYDNWMATALAPEEKIDIWLVWLSALGYSAGGTEWRATDIEGVLAGVTAALGRGERVVTILPEALEGAEPYSVAEAWQRALRAELDGALPAAVIRVDPDRVHRQRGDAAWFAARYWTLAKSPCHPDAATLLGHAVANAVSRMLKPKVKAVAVDLDDMLWGGIVGEAGVAGVALDPFGEGRPYLQLQRFLKDLSAAGIPISVVSKNNPDDARAPFLERREMILSLADCVYFHAGWEAKTIALRRIAADLNIGIEALCFLDDSLHEREEARSLVPGLIVPELPADPEARMGFLAASGLFSQPVVGATDRARVDYYKDQARRDSLLAESGDVEAYLRGLDMRLTAWPIGPDNIQRVASLIHKTNQFNLTNRRHSDAELSRILAVPGVYAYCYGLADRFGDAGIIAVVIGRPAEDGLEIDTFLMSCRVINRGVDSAVLDHLLRWSRGRGVNTLIGLYAPTAKNALVAELYPRLGFVAVAVAGAGGDLRFMGRGLAAPSHAITIEK